MSVASTVVASAGLGAEPAVADRSPAIYIIEDDAAAGRLAEDVVRLLGARPRLFRSPLPFLRACSDEEEPTILVLDWRLDNEVSAAVFLTTRHRFASLPVVIWSGVSAAELPGVVHADPLTEVVSKTAGSDVLLAALNRALCRSLALAS